jgi:hypothetical protein
MGVRWAFMERFEVPDYDNEDDPDRNYLTRLRIIQTPWFGIYLHRFDAPDPRPTLHDHPWNFRSLVLRGGYVEADCYSTSPGKVPAGRNDWGIPVESLRTHGGWVRFTRGKVNAKRAEGLHTIVELLRVPTWTLMLVGRRRRVWGYTDPDGTWTAFDRHPNAVAFDAAMARRGPKAGLY